MRSGYWPVVVWIARQIANKIAVVIEPMIVVFTVKLSFDEPSRAARVHC